MNSAVPSMNFSNACSEEKEYKNCDSAIFSDDGYQRRKMNIENIRRYTRAALISLRNSSRSKRRPECSLRSDLQGLGVWRHVNPSADRTGGGDSIQTNTSAIAMQGRKVHTSCSGAHYTPTSIAQKTYIDQRSISSSHLMPAFAKRKMVVAMTVPPIASDIDSRTNHLRSQTPIDAKENQSYKQSSYVDRNREQSGVKINSPQHKTTGDHQENKSRMERSSDDYYGTAGSRANSRYSQYNVCHDRRIGSGRLIPRDVNWDYRGGQQEREKIQYAGGEKDTTPSGNANQRNLCRYGDRSQDARNDFGEKLANERKLNTAVNDDEKNKDSLKERFRGCNEGSFNYSNHNRHQPRHHSPINLGRGRRHNSYNEKFEEPEWFSGGPTSQLDTIELRGFEEVDDRSDDEESGLNDGNGDKKDSTQSTSDRSAQLVNSDQTTNQLEIQEKSIQNTTNDAKDDGKDVNKNEEKTLENDFNLDVFLNIEHLDDHIGQVDMGDGSSPRNIGGSRFTRWFTQAANNNSTLPPADEHGSKMGENDLHKNNDKQRNTLHEFLEQTKLPKAVLVEGGVPRNASITSVEELEASMRRLNNRSSLEVAKTEVAEDANAFKKLLERLNHEGNPENQLQSGQNHEHGTPPMINATTHTPGEGVIMDFPHPLPSTQELLRAEEIRRFMHQQQLVHQTQQEKLMQSILAPQLIRRPLMNSAGGEAEMYLYPLLPPPILAIIASHPQKVLEPQYLLRSVLCGEISVPYLEQELSNPNVPPQLKEMFGLVLSEIARQPAPPAFMPLAPLAQRQVHPLTVGLNNQGDQTQHKSHQNSASRIDAYSQSDMMIVNKIEDQTQQQQHGMQKQDSPIHQNPQHSCSSSNRQSPAPNCLQNTRFLNSPTPLAFMPTSVLRKMTAEKDSSNVHLHTAAINSGQHHQESQINQQVQQQMYQKQQQHQINRQQAAAPQLRMILGSGVSQMGQQQPPSHTQELPAQLVHHGIGHALRMQQIAPPPAKWPMVGNSFDPALCAIKPMGRPILKGPTPCQTQMQQMLKNNTKTSQLLPQAQMSFMGNIQQQQQLFQQPQRMLPMHQQQQQQRIQDITNKPDRLSVNDVRYQGKSSEIINFHRDRSLSPTSNQLAQWFSPELLAQASAGKLPLLNVNEALSLEEFERNIQHSSAPVQN